MISPIFLLPFLRSVRFGLTFNLMAILLTSFVKLLPKLFFDFELIPYEIRDLDSVEDMKQSFLRFFFFTDQYIYLFVFGITIGYFLKERPLLIRKLTKTKLARLTLTLISYSSMVLAIVWSEDFKDINKDQNQANLMIWFVLGDILWSMGLIWTIFLLRKPKKGTIN